MLKNKGFLYIALIILSASIIGLGQLRSNDLQESYPGLDKFNNITVLSSKELIEKINQKDSFVVTLGFKECPWCQALIPSLDLASKNARMDVFYCDILNMRMDPTGPLMDDYEFLKQAFYDLTIENHTKIGAPTTALFVNGKFVKGFTDTVVDHVKNENGVLPPLSADQQNRLLIRLTDLFNELK